MINCFVTFCEDDAERVHVELLVQHLKQETGSKINYLVFYKEQFGDSLDEFMLENMRSCDCVLGLFGPEYKKRIDQTMSKSGAFIEYDMLISRLNEAIPGPKPKLVPVQWAGTSIGASIPTLIMAPNPYVCDLTTFRASGVVIGKPFLPKALQDKHAKTIKGISEALLLQENIASPEAKRHHSTALQKFLLDQADDDVDPKLDVNEVLKLKYEEGKYTTERFRKQLYTKTRFSRRLSDKSVGLISGRKGSGKTTLVQVKEHDAKVQHHFPVIDISVNQWKLHMLIQNQTFVQAESDFRYVDLEINFFDFVWPTFTGLCVAVSLIFDKRNAGKPGSAGQLITDAQTARTLDTHIAECKSIKDVRYDTIFELSVLFSRRYIQGVVDKADSSNEDSFRLDVLKSVSISQALYSIFGSEFQRLRNAIDEQQDEEHSRQFLFGFDRFDTEIQKYRQFDNHMDDATRASRATREVDWLSSLTKFVNKSVNHDRLSKNETFYDFYSIVKFLVILPYDRVKEIFDSQRDSITSEVVEEIHWQPKELLTMLRKRLQVLYGISDTDISKEKNVSPEQRFQRCLAAGKIPLPEKSYILLGAKKFEMELFLYVLRHSLFRPRDILIHYAAILGHVESFRNRGDRDTRESIREVVSRESQRIVLNEFLGELRDTWTNIDKVLELFMGQQQVMSARELENVIGGQNFSFYYEIIGISDFSKKVEFLYDIGFLGFRTTRNGAADRQREFNFTFIRREENLPFKSENVMKHMEFAIHPLFVEHLFLGIDHRKPVLNFTWSELNKIDRIN